MFISKEREKMENDFCVDPMDPLDEKKSMQSLYRYTVRCNVLASALLKLELFNIRAYTDSVLQEFALVYGKYFKV